MATRNGHVPGGPLTGNLTHGVNAPVSVPERRAPLAGDTEGDVPPFAGKSSRRKRSIADYTPPSPIRGNGPGTESGDPDLRLNWSRMPEKKAGARLWQMVAAHERGLSWRHYMALRGAAAYSGIGLGDLFENLSPYDGPRGSQWKRKGRDSFAYGGWGSQSCERHARASAETIVEKLTGLIEPKTQMVATDVEWELRRQGIWADRFIEGNMHLPQGSYLDTWDLWRQGALLAFCSTGTVAARIEPDYVSKRVRTQLRSTLNTFIDPGDVACAMPLSYFDLTWENPEYMIEDPRYQGAANAWKRDAIWKASKVPPHQNAGNYDGASFGTRMVKWLSAWRMPFGSFKGRQAVCVEGAPPILWEDWEFPQPPLAFYRVNRCLGEDFWGENFIEIMLDPLSDAEDIDDIAKRTMKLTSQTFLHLDGTSTAPASVLNALDVNVCKYDSNKGERKAEVEKPGLLHADYFAWRDRKIAIAQQLSGVPDSHIASQSGTHLQSGRAIRLDSSLLPERFARKLRGLQHWIAVDIATQQIRAAREIGEVEPNWQVTWPGADFDSKVSVKVLDIDDTIYELRPYVVSESKNTPADRAEMAQEMLDRKQITLAQHSVIMDGLLDTPKETAEISSQRKEIAKTVDDILHADEDIISDEAAYMGNRYTPPDPWIDPGAAMAQILPLYRQAMVDGVPQNRRNLLKRLIEDVMAIDSNNKRDAAMRNASVNVAATAQQAGLAGPQPAALPPAPMGAPADMGIAPPMAAEPVQNVGGAPGMA